MYPYAFYSRILAIVALILTAFLGLPTSFQYFRLKAKVNEAQNVIQNAQREQAVLNSLVPQIAFYSQKDPTILPLLQKYGISPPPSAQVQPTPKPKKK